MGRPAKDSNKLRQYLVAVRLTADEMARVDVYRADSGIGRGEWVRRAALAKPPRTIPAINREAWQELAKLAGNLNQLTRAINEGRTNLPSVDFEGLRELVQQLRLELIGVQAE